MNVHSTIVIAALALAACVSDGGSSEDTGGTAGDSVRPLTCALIQGQNCWTDAIGATAACAPGATETGALSGDGLSCSFSSGARASFASDPTKLGIDDDLTFAVETQDTPCTSFSHTRGVDDIRTLVTELGEARWTYGDLVTLSCPDGAVYRTDALTALQCQGLSSAMGFVFGAGDNTFSFALTATPATVPVLRCGR